MDANASLTLERIFAAPPLGGALPAAAKLSPDGSLLTFLQAAADDRERLDLWCIDTATLQRRCLVNAAALSGNAELSEEEKARRERKRVFQHGIVEYEWQADGQSLVFPMAGVVYRYLLDGGALQPLTPAGSQQTDVRLSPDARFAAYVRDGDLYCYELAAQREQRLTHGASATLTHGIAEFIAQEEMHRFEGWWWSPDSQRIAYTRVDSSGIPETHRHEIHADGIVMHPQRYPFAGDANARVQLCIVTLASGASTEVPWLAADSEYLARVNWTHDGQGLLIQRQNRLQNVLQLVRIDIASGTQRVLTEEHSTTWVNLHDNLQLLGADRLLWTSERDGYSHLYEIVGDAGARQITRGDWMITRVHGTSPDGATAYVSGWQNDPTALHLFAVGLADGSTRRLTRAEGWHQIVLSKDATVALDTWSAPDALPHVDRIDLGSGETRTLIANDIDGAHPLHAYANVLATTEFGVLAAEDGQALQWCLVKPRDFEPARRYPVLLSVYGGPGVSRVHREWMPWWYHYLAGQGVLVFALDNRGSALRGRAFEAPIHRAFGIAEVADQLRGLDWLQQQPFVDPARIAVAGHSYGGYMTLMLLAKAPGRFTCGISTAPVSDWHLYDTHYTERYLGLPQENVAGYRDSGVLPWLPTLRDPLLLMHGMADDNVLFTHSTALMKALQDQLTPFELMTYPGSKHGLAEQRVALHRHRLMFDFLARHLRLGSG